MALETLSRTLEVPRRSLNGWSQPQQPLSSTGQRSTPSKRRWGDRRNSTISTAATCTVPALDAPGWLMSAARWRFQCR
jgi:hypothetical protein